MMMYNHPYHLVTFSPWPMLVSLSLMNFMISLVMWMYNMNLFFMCMLNMINLVMCMVQWWRDVIRESTFQGFHTNMVIIFIKFNMILFIISELFFFISFFWAYFHNFISMNIEIGLIWPPMNIVKFNAYDIPLLNSIILISSGFTITWCHNLLLNSEYLDCMKSLLMTILLGIYFVMLQYMEYYEAMFCINDSIYGSIFYMMTGFHGLHVLVGVVMLITTFYRLYMNHFSTIHHINFETTLWYWHFVDVIWLFLYMIIY